MKYLFYATFTSNPEQMANMIWKIYFLPKMRSAMRTKRCDHCSSVTEDPRAAASQESKYCLTGEAHTVRPASVLL